MFFLRRLIFIPAGNSDFVVFSFSTWIILSLTEIIWSQCRDLISVDTCWLSQEMQWLQISLEEVKCRFIFDGRYFDALWIRIPVYFPWKSRFIRYNFYFNDLFRYRDNYRNYPPMNIEIILLPVADSLCAPLTFLLHSWGYGL